jgi:hypothetical protein
MNTDEMDDKATYEITFYNGDWKVTPTRERIIDCLTHVFRDRDVAHVTAIRVRLPYDHEEEGIHQVAHVDVVFGDTHNEVVRDAFYGALLSRFVPEYDSLLEIEIVDPLTV